MVAKKYIPERGDLVWVSLTQTRGHEQSGRRPAVVVSRKEYNEKSGLVLACPVTSKVKGYPFEVCVSGEEISGAILVDQVRSVDWQARGVTFAGIVKREDMEEILAKLRALVQ